MLHVSPFFAFFAGFVSLALRVDAALGMLSDVELDEYCLDNSGDVSERSGSVVENIDLDEGV